FLYWDPCILDDVMKEGGAERSHIKLHVRKQMGYFERVGEVWLAREASLRLVLLGREVVRTPKEIEVIARAVPAHLVSQLDETEIDRAARRKTDCRVAGRVHTPL